MRYDLAVLVYTWAHAQSVYYYDYSKNITSTTLVGINPPNLGVVKGDREGPLG